MAELKEYIVLAGKGFLNDALRELEPMTETGGRRASFVAKSKLAGGRDVRVVHSIAANGPKLVELDELAARAINLHPDLRALHPVEYARPLTRSIVQASYPLSPPIPKRPDEGSEVTIRVWEKKKGKRVRAGGGFVVTALSNYAANIGEQKVTDDSGEVTLRVSGKTIERLCCEYLWGWGAFRKNTRVRSPYDLELKPLREGFTDCVRRYYGGSRFDPGTGVTVGVIDTGVGPHDDLNPNVVGGLNAVLGMSPQDYQDADGHGTFVAGLIGSLGERFPKLRGLAPGVRIRSYRIFGSGIGLTSSYPVIRAMLQAQSDGCDILNLSLETTGERRRDEALQEAIADARNHGMIVVAAAGNDNRDAVDYPAAYPDATAVSAMGREGTFPRGALEEMTVRPPKGDRDPKEFIASFSNYGKQISVTALGVGVLSTLPGNDWGSSSGTSFAAPVVAGAAACLLSRNPAIYRMSRNRARSDAIEQLLIANCIKRGFGPVFEGHGMPDPERV